jgi:hypothetical protein
VNEEQSVSPTKRAGLYFSDPACIGHDPRVHMPGHPDTPERLQAIEQALAARDWLGWERREAPPAQEAQLELIHTSRHVQRIKELSLAGGGAIDPDTFVGEPSYRAALHAAGGACEMARALMAHEATLGFCGVRPSGHHAEPDRAMGFCLFTTSRSRRSSRSQSSVSSAYSSSIGTSITATAPPRLSAAAQMSYSRASTSPGSTPGRAG